MAAARRAQKDPERPSEGGLDANVAALLTWVVPGSAHLMMGRAGLALGAFLVIEGLFWFGLRLSGGMTFEFLDPELRTRFAPALAPELGNLGGFVHQLRTYGYGPGFLRPWPEGIVAGGMLTALSGILNACLMVHAHVSARRSKARAVGADRTAVAVLLAWLVPGLGHVHQGRRGRGLAVFLVLVGLFALGTFLAEGSNLSRERHFYYWSGQFFLGAPALVAEWIGGGMRIDHSIALVDAGLVFGCVAGLLNVLAMIDVFDFSEARVFGWPHRSARRAAGERGAAEA